MLKDEQKNCEVDMILEAIANAVKDFSLGFKVSSSFRGEGGVSQRLSD